MRVENERSAHSEDAAKQPRLEHNVVSWSSLARLTAFGCGWALGCPVVASEYEGGEIDLARELEQPLQCRGPGIERSGPRLYVRDVFETARQRLQQLCLLRR